MIKSLKPQASSLKRLELGSWLQLRNEAGDHFVQFLQPIDESRNLIDITEVEGNNEQSFEFLRGTKANEKKAAKLGVRTSTVPLSNIGGNGNCGSLNLRNKAEGLLGRKRLAKSVKIDAQNFALFPNLQISKVRFSRTALVGYYSQLGACGLRLAAGGCHG